MIKLILYKLLDIITLGKGIKRNFKGNTVRVPTRYFRYFPNGYEDDTFEFVNKEIKEGMVVLDIGAHIGIIAVPLAKKVGANGKVYAFEPTPTTVSILKETIRINNIKNISVQPYALANTKGKLIFYTSDNKVDNSNSLIDNHRLDRKENKIEVEVNTLDDFKVSSNISKIDFIKIDVEGAELRVLKGAAKTIGQDKPKMVLSMHPASIKNSGDSAEEIWNFLNGYGYKILLENKEMSKEDFISRQGLFDVFAI